MEGTVRCSANYVPLSPLSFLERAAVVYGDRTSVVYGPIRYTWGQTRDRCLRLASGLDHLGISRGDVVTNYLSLYFLESISSSFNLISGSELILGASYCSLI